MSDDDLLRRFAALKSTPGQTIPAKLPKEADEDEDLARIADGRPLDPNSKWGSLWEGDDDDVSLLCEIR